MLKKTFSYFFIIQNFLCKFSKIFSNFTLFSVYFFCKLPTIAGHRVTRVCFWQLLPKARFIHG